MGSWDSTCRVMSWNANGVLTRVVNGEEVGDEDVGGRQRWMFLASMVVNYGIEIVGIQEPRVSGWGWAEKLQVVWRKKGFESVWSIENPGSRGMGLLWKVSVWSLVSVVSVGQD
jgi:exonuclease III